MQVSWDRGKKGGRIWDDRNLVGVKFVNFYRWDIEDLIVRCGMKIRNKYGV